MLKLMKYELRKTWFTKVILLVITAVAEAAFLAGLYGNGDEVMLIGVFLLMFLAMGGVMVMGLESVITLHRDMNTKQSYMLFMTPNSSYKILGAKVLECGISILLIGAFFFGLGALDVTLLFAKMGELNQLWEMVQTMLNSITINGRVLEVDLVHFAALMFNMLSAWIVMITTAYLADVISSALLNGQKFNGVISFVLFLVLNWGITELTRTVTGGIASQMTAMLVSGLIDLGLAAVMYYATALIMDRYLSV